MRENGYNDFDFCYDQDEEAKEENGTASLRTYDDSISWSQACVIIRNDGDDDDDEDMALLPKNGHVSVITRLVKNLRSSTLLNSFQCFFECRASTTQDGQPVG